MRTYITANKIQATRDDSGLYYTTEGNGSGEFAKDGNNVTVHYTGKLLDGTVFDSSYPRKEPFEFKLGSGMVIKGWDIGLHFFRKGDKGVLYIPSALGYGARGAGRAIPPNSDLIFEIELVDIR